MRPSQNQNREPIVIRIKTPYGTDEELRIDFHRDGTTVSYSGPLERLKERTRKLPGAYSTNQNLGKKVFHWFRDGIAEVTQTPVDLEVTLSSDIKGKRIMQIPVYFLEFMQQP